MSFGGRGGSAGLRGDMNVTPLVDVVLVMLVIFLVAMPVVMRLIQVDVPRTEAQGRAIFAPIVVEVTKDGAILFDGVAISRADLAEKVHARMESKRERVVYVDFDESVRYGEAVSVMDTLKGAGAETVALKVKEAPATGSRPADSPDRR